MTRDMHTHTHTHTRTHTSHIAFSRHNTVQFAFEGRGSSRTCSWLDKAKQICTNLYTSFSLHLSPCINTVKIHIFTRTWATKRELFMANSASLALQYCTQMVVGGQTWVTPPFVTSCCLAFLDYLCSVHAISDHLKWLLERERPLFAPVTFLRRCETINPRY